MKFTIPTPLLISFFFCYFFQCVKRSLILCFNIWIYIVWLAQQKEKQLDKRKDNGLNLPLFNFCSTVIFKITFAVLLDSAPNLRILRDRGSDTEHVEMKRNRGKWLSAVCELVSSGWRRRRLVGRSLQSSHSTSWKFSWKSQITLLQEANQPAPLALLKTDRQWSTRVFSDRHHLCCCLIFFLCYIFPNGFFSPLFLCR